MKNQTQRGNIFLLVFFTSLSVLLFSTKIAEFCAIGTFIILPCIFGWANVLDNK